MSSKIGGEADGSVMVPEAMPDLPYWSRTYASYPERFVHPFTLQLAPNSQLSFSQAPCVSAEHAREARASADGSCTASTVWDAGIVLAEHVYNSYIGLQSSPSQSSTAACRCLDLGSGTGIVGLSAAASGAFGSVVLSDLPSVVPLLRKNARENSTAIGPDVSVTSLALVWDDHAALEKAAELGPYTLILGGDLLYRPQVVEPLLTALTRLTQESTVVLLAASLGHSPETLTLFTQRAGEEGFVVECLRETALKTFEFSSDEVRMLSLRRRGAQGQAPGIGEGTKQGIRISESQEDLSARAPKRPRGD